MNERSADVTVVGAGIAGASLASRLAAGGLDVVLLERRHTFADVVRGELISPWGLAEAERLGTLEPLEAAGLWNVHWWGQWDEVTPRDAAPMVDLRRFTVDGIESPATLSHHLSCAALTDHARLQGATVCMGVQDVRVERTDRPVTTYVVDGEQVRLTSRAVIGAGGMYGRVGAQLGVTRTERCTHWGGGLAVEGLDDWPGDTIAIGTEGDVMFFVFPRGGGEARLYLQYAPETQERFNGPDRVRRFLDAFRLSSLPGSEQIPDCRPTARLACFPGSVYDVDRIVVDDVVLIGDEAGKSDHVLGTGLSTALRDARLVADALLDGADWRAGFAAYEAERTERMRRLHACADLMARLYIDFGDLARRRRARAFALMQQNPMHALFLLATGLGPEALPDGPFIDYLCDRLLTA